MGTNQRYSQRIYTKRQFTKVSDDLRHANLILCEIADRYKVALPVISTGCRVMVDNLSMLESMVRDLRENI